MKVLMTATTLCSKVGSIGTCMNQKREKRVSQPVRKTAKEGVVGVGRPLVRIASVDDSVWIFTQSSP